jgi:hypothetical protein
MSVGRSLFQHFRAWPIVIYPLAYNQFCGDRKGMPLLNQTPSLNASMLQKAYGDN